MTLTVQFITMITMIVTGIICGAAFDTYVKLLRHSKTHRGLIFIKDVLFWLIQAVLIFYLLYNINDGEIRFYIFLALLCGFAAYQSLFKTGYLKLLAFIIRTIKSIYEFVIKLLKTVIFNPFKTIILLLGTFMFIILKGLWTLVKYMLNILLFLVGLILTPLLSPFKKISLVVYDKFLRKTVTKLLKKVYNINYNVKNSIKTICRFFRNDDH